MRQTAADEVDVAVHLQHSGDLSWRDFPALAESVKRHLASRDLASAHRRRAFSTFVEMTYNVLNHGLAAPPRPGDAGRRVPAHLALGTAQGLVWIASTNGVSGEAAPALEQRVRALREMDPALLRSSYREQLARGDSRAGACGGLGLLTIARDAARPIEFALAPAPSHGEFVFQMKVVV